MKVIGGDKHHPSFDSNTEMSVLEPVFNPFFNRLFWSISSFVCRVGFDDYMLVLFD